jgi:methionine-rich copper-binding protein CopC
MVGLWLACLSLFAIVRRRSNLVLGACAAMLPLWTAAFRYGVEARGYGPLLGCFGVSAFAWSEAATGERRAAYLPLLALSLAAGVWAHYYGVFNIAVLVLGEITRDVRRRELDWGVWGAIIAACALILPLHDLAVPAVAQSGHSWAILGPESIRDAYGFLLQPLVDMRLLGALVLLTVLCRQAPFAHASSRRQIPAHEAVAAAACLLIPVFGMLARRLELGVFFPRYALSMVIGAVPFVLLAAWVGSRRSKLVPVAVCAFLTANLAQSTWAAHATLSTPRPDPVAERPVLTEALRRGDDVCITGGLLYLQFWYYAPPPLKPRLCYLVEPASARRLVGTDSFDNGFIALSRWSAVTALDYDRFVSQHRTFTVYAAGTGWLLARLRESGASIRETGVETGFRIYEITLPPS